MKKSLKAVVILIAVLLAASSYSVAFAADDSESMIGTGKTVTGRSVHVNPVYDDILTEDDIAQGGKASTDGKLKLQADYETDESKLIETIRTAMENRQTELTLNFKSDDKPEDALLSNWIDAALSETDSPSQGDYIRYVYGGYSSSWSFYYDGGKWNTTFDILFTFYTTREQEQELTEELDSVMESFDFTDSTSDYEKVYKIYEYITSNITYDYDNLYDDSYMLKYSAYAALINKTAVCQGYADLLYRMLRTAGISTRVITGVSNGEGHAWNIALVDGKYYLLDSTWDAGNSSYSYFLKGSKTFEDHQTDEEFLTSDFTSKYPMSEDDYTGAKIIRIDGFEYLVKNSKASLIGYTGSGTDVKVPASAEGNQVTTIGQHSFRGADTIRTLTLSEGIATLEQESIFEMKNLETLNLPSTLKIPYENTQGLINGVSAVPVHCPALKTVTVPEDSGYLSVEDGVLFNKDMTALLYYPSGKDNAFYAVPDAVKIIGSSAFDGTALWEIELPASLESIDLNGSTLASLKAWEVAEGSKSYSAADGVLLDKDKKQIIHIPEQKSGKYVSPDTVTSISAQAVIKTQLSSIRLPQSAAIGEDNFQTYPSGFLIFGYERSSAEAYTKQNGIEFVSIGVAGEETVDSGDCGDRAVWTLNSTGVLRISGKGEMSWGGSDSPWASHRADIVKVVIGEGLENIPGDVFNNYDSLTEVTLSGSVKTIGEDAFGDCEQLVSINVAENNAVYKSDDGVLFSKDGKTLIAYPTGKYTSYVVPDTVEKIEPNAFSHASLMSLLIPDSVTEIAKGAFAYTSADSIFTGAGIIEIPDETFFQCSVGKLAIGKNVASIGENAFKGVVPGAVYFCGTEAEWNNVSKGDGNDTLLTGSVVFGAVKPCDVGIHQVEHAAYKAPTCTEEGNIEHYICNECGSHFSDPYGKVTIDDDSWVLQAEDHEWDDGTITKQPTYTEEGVRTYTCGKCKETRTEAIKKLINPSKVKVTIATPKAAKKAITVKWKKLSAANRGAVSGIQIQYSLKKNFKDAKTVKASKTATSKKISKLKSKKIYYVRIRVYKGSKKGPWSTRKKVRTK